MAFADAKQGREYANWFDEGVSQLRANGGLSEIPKKYSLGDWKESSP